MRNSKTNELVLTGLFTAIIIIMAFTPLGYIPLVVINATEYSCAITPQVRQAGNRLSGLTETAYASLLA